MALNSQFFLKNGGNFVISIKVCTVFITFHAATLCCDDLLRPELLMVLKCFKTGLIQPSFCVLSPVDKAELYYDTSYVLQANCIDSTAEPEAVFAGEVKKMQAEKMKPQEQVDQQMLAYC